VGDLGVDPVVVGPGSGIGILTTYGPRVSNTATGSVSRMITGHVSAQASGNYSTQRFLGDNSGLAVDNTTWGGSGGISYHFDTRNVLTGNYNFSRFTYSSGQYGFSTQGATIDYSRQWSRRFSTDVYAGPQVITGSQTAVSGTSVQIAAGATASYLSRLTTYNLSYSRGVNNGSGVVSGSFSDNLMLGAHRAFGKAWAGSGFLGYTHSTSLPNATFGTYSSQSVSASAQGSRSLGRRFSVFLAYTIQNQSTSGTYRAANAFNGVYQTGSIGLTYSPGAVLLGR
jgi:hypothetical protein